jgi:8-oxo-dGTP pyrophosphatase MutT (NUDIX family)
MTPDLIDRIGRALAADGGGSSDFDLNPGTPRARAGTLRPAGVLAAIVPRSGRFDILLTKRSSALKHHPGQIAFPGGKQDSADADVVAAALREADEEIGLPPSHVQVLGCLPSHETVTGFDVTPVIGLVTRDFTLRPEPGEVEEIFHVPLDHVLDPRNFLIQARRWRGQMRSYYTVPYGPYYIWGATARILRAWGDRM